MFILEKVDTPVKLGTIRYILEKNSYISKCRDK